MSDFINTAVCLVFGTSITWLAISYAEKHKWEFPLPYAFAGAVVMLSAIPFLLIKALIWKALS